MTSHMCACQKDEDNSLNYFEPKDNDDKWTKEKYKDVIFHELVHAIEYKLYGIHPEWLTEGIAKYLDGTYSKGIKYLFENYIHKNRIPSMYELKYEFGEHENEYDSYDYAYLMVSYLIEINGKEKLIEILKGIRPDIEIENKTLVDDGVLDSFDIVTLVSELIDAYDIELSVEDILPENFNSVEAIQQLIDSKK